jgi:excisionase family DNA binding protein
MWNIAHFKRKGNEGMNETELMTAAEVAQRLGMTYQAAHRAIARGELPVCYFGRSRRVPRKAFELWLRDINAEAVARQTMKILEAIGNAR